MMNEQPYVSNDNQAWDAAPQGPFHCLNLTFPADNARREHFLAVLP